MMDKNQPSYHELEEHIQKLKQQNNLLKLIAEQKEKDYILLHLEIRFRKLFENMPSGVAIYKSIENGLDFEFIGFNKATN